MLAPGDNKLVERDQALPGLAILLDPDRMAELIQRLFACPPLGSLTPNYVRYKPGTSCLVGYEAQVGVVTLPLYARTHTVEASIKATTVLKRSHAPGPLGVGAAITADPPIAVFAFPNDHELRVAKDLFDDRRRTAPLGRMLPTNTALHAGDLRVLRYKPERRLVASLAGLDGTRVVLRVHAEGAAQTTVTNNAPGDACHSGSTAIPDHAPSNPGTVQLPRFLGASTVDRVAIYEWIQGEPLDASLTSATVDTGQLDRVGGALARWHHEARSRLATAPASIPSSREAADAITAIDWSLGDRAIALAARIDAALVGVDLPLTRIHGDFSAEQVILADRGIAFIDLDRSTIGYGLEDLATFRARLIADAIAGRCTLANAVAWNDRFTAAYFRADNNPPVDRALAAFTARALLRLAPEPFRKRLRDWPSKSAQILAAAAEASP